MAVQSATPPRQAESSRGGRRGSRVKWESCAHSSRPPPVLAMCSPTISLAHALRAAGHEVLVATAGGKEAANAGLHVVDTAPGVDIGAVFQQAASEQPEEFDYSTDVDTEKGLEFVGAIFAKLSGVSVDLTVSAAESWRPDVVVYSSMEGTGPLVAAKLGVPAVSHGFGFTDEASM